MDRRLLNFVVLSGAFFICFTLLRLQFLPPPQKAANNAGGAAQQAGDDEADGGQKDPKDASAGDDTDSPANDSHSAKEAEAADSEAADSKATDSATTEGDSEKQDSNADEEKPIRWFTLGSMDPSANYNLMLTLCTQGGGIERAELVARDDNGRLKYRRVDVRHGYLGYFAGQRAEKVDGVLVNVVGPGTPAALAKADTGEVGLQVGDVILAVGGKAVASHDDIDKALAKTLPGKNISVEVLRPATLAESSGETADESDAGDDADSAEEANNIANAGARELTFTAKLTHHPLDLIRLSKYGGVDQIVGNDSRRSSLVTLGQVNRKTILGSEHWIAALGDHAEWVWDANKKQVDGGGESLELSLKLGDKMMASAGGAPVQLSRTFELKPDAYTVGMSVDVKNVSDEPQDLALRLEGVNGVTMEGWWYSNKISPNWTASSARDLVYKTDGDGHELISGVALLKHARKEPKDADQGVFASDSSDEDRALRYMAIDAQYFVVGYIPPGGESAMTNFRRASLGIVANEKQVQKHKERAINTSFYLDSQIETVPPGDSIRQELQLFAGPKEPEVAEEHNLQDSVYYGWFWFIAKPLASLLHLLYAIVRNYGVAIILLTVIVRGAMFPLSRKAAINAQRMQELAPELKKIAEKYKDDMEGRLKAQRELQQRVGFNPMAGCLPMFLQLPIFVGLYRALCVDIELRQKPLFSFTSWASNLAAPDQLYYWGDWMPDFLAGRGTGWLGPYFNLLPLIVVALFLTQQKMFMPPATDEQTAMTQKVMTIMTMMMGLFFFRVPAGLCLYFIASSLWGICERIVVKKTLPQGKHFDQSVIDGTATTKSTEKENKFSFADRMRQQMGKVEEKPAEKPSKRRRPPIKKKR